MMFEWTLAPRVGEPIIIHRCDIFARTSYVIQLYTALNPDSNDPPPQKFLLMQFRTFPLKLCKYPYGMKQGKTALNIAKKRYSNRNTSPYPINFIWDGKVTKYLLRYEDNRLTDGVYRSESGKAALQFSGAFRRDAPSDFRIESRCGGQSPRVIFHPLALAAAKTRLQTSKCMILLLRYRLNRSKKRFVSNSTTGVYRLNSHSLTTSTEWRLYLIKENTNNLCTVANYWVFSVMSLKSRGLRVRCIK